MAKITTAALQALRSLSLPLPPPPSFPCHSCRSCLHLRLRRSQASARRTYHSYEHDAPAPFPPAENAILSSAIPHISTHGFTTAALSQGARDVGYLDASINLFPAGAFALVNYHLVTQRLALADHRSTIRQQAGGGIAEQINTLAWKRLQANKPIIHRWQEVRLFVQLLSPSFQLPSLGSPLFRPPPHDICYLQNANLSPCSYYASLPPSQPVRHVNPPTLNFPLD